MTKNGSEFTYTHGFANAGSKRVYAKTANGTTSNTIEITANALKKTLEAPVGGTMTATVDEEVTISWGAVANATGYTAHLYEMVDGQLESIGDVTSLINGTSLKYTFTETGEYHVGVIATAEGYNPSEQSAVIVTVSEKVDNTRPWFENLAITKDEIVLSDEIPTLELSGKVFDDTELAQIEVHIGQYSHSIYYKVNADENTKERDLSSMSFALINWNKLGRFDVKINATDATGNKAFDNPMLIGYVTFNEEALETIQLTADTTEINAGDSVTFTAQSNADSVTLYIEAYNEVADEWYVAVTKEMTKNGSEFTYTHEFANAGSKRVYAKTANGTTSNAIEITANALKETLEAPVGGTLTATVGEEVTISWGAVVNATGYTAHLYEMVDGKLESIGDVTSLISGTSLKYTFTETGEYHVGVIATAEGYNPSEQSAVIVTIEAAISVPDTQSPVIDPIISTIVSPITAGTEVTFSTTAADDVKLAKIELFIDGDLKKTETVSGLSGTISYTTSALAVGEHTVMVVATDASGLTNDVSLTVTVQKAESGDCAHKNTTIVRTQEYVSLGAEQHKLVYTDWTHCLDCDTGLSNVQDEDLPEKHTWKDGACEKCKHACGHNFELVVNEKGENVAVVGSGKWQRQDDDYHVCTEIKYQTKCATCGLMGESDYKPAGWTEKHDYKWAAGGVDRNDAQHRFYEEHICSLAACGDRKTVGEWENHQYVNGVCSCGAKEANNSGGSSSNNITNGNDTNNNSVDDVDDGEDEFNGTVPDYSTDVEKLPYHFGDYQLADQIQGNVNPTMAAVYAAIAGGVYDNIATIVMSNVAQNNFEKEMYKKALVRVMADVPSTELTEKQQAELKAISGLSSFANGQSKVVDKIVELTGYSDNDNIKALSAFVKVMSQTLDSCSELSDEEKEILEAQFYGKILYFEALKANAGSVEPLLDAISELEQEYTDKFVVKVKDYAQATVDGAFDWGKEIGTDIIDLAIEGAGDEATAKALKHISSVLKGLEIADFALGVIDEVGGYGEYAEGYQELLVLDAIQGTIACSYLETVFDLQSKIEDGEQLTDEEYAYLVACYDLMRGCLISKNMSARKIWDRTENQENRQEVLRQLRNEIDELRKMSIDEWHLNEYYRDDFFESPSATINQGYYFDAIIDGGEYSAKAENEDEKIGIASKYDELSSVEKDVVNETEDGLARFANAFASSANNAAFKLTLVENRNKLSSAIIIEDGFGNAMILACESLYGNPWVKVVDADALNYQLSNNRLDVDCVMSNGYVKVSETALSDKRTTWTINKAGVESILREYVDNQQAQINDDPKVSISKNEEFTMDLLKTVLDHNPWDSFEGLSKQVVAEEYKP